MQVAHRDRGVAVAGRQGRDGALALVVLTLGGTACPHYLSNRASFVVFVFRRVKDDHNLLHHSPRLKKTCIREAVIDKWFPPMTAGHHLAVVAQQRRVERACGHLLLLLLSLLLVYIALVIIICLSCIVLVIAVLLIVSLLLLLSFRRGEGTVD